MIDTVRGLVEAGEITPRRRQVMIPFDYLLGFPRKGLPHMANKGPVNDIERAALDMWQRAQPVTAMRILRDGGYDSEARARFLRDVAGCREDVADYAADSYMAPFNLVDSSKGVSTYRRQVGAFEVTTDDSNCIVLIGHCGHGFTVTNVAALTAALDDARMFVRVREGDRT